MMSLRLRHRSLPVPKARTHHQYKPRRRCADAPAEAGDPGRTVGVWFAYDPAMPDVTVPRVSLDLPLVCIMTGESEGVVLEDVILRKRGASLVWGLIGFFVLGWLGALLAIHFLPRKIPLGLPISRRGSRQWRGAQNLMILAMFVGFGLNLLGLTAVRTGASFAWIGNWPLEAWVGLGVSIGLPILAYRLLLWNRQPWLRKSRGLVVDVWIPSAEAAEAISTRVKPIVERAERLEQG